MKKYFTKYIPVDGAIKEGDTVLREWYPPTQGFKREIVKYRSGMQSLSEKKVNLFLCSNEMQPGDNVVNLFGNASLYKRGKYFSDSELEDTCYINTSSGGEQCVKSHWAKIICEIPPECYWVKEGDEFETTEVIKLIKSHA